MRQLSEKDDMIKQLQREVRSLQGFKRASDSHRPDIGLGPIEMAFPERTFPTGAVHEFISPTAEDAAATNGFITGILGHLMQASGTTLWVSTKRTLFPAALKVFGIDPERIIFVDVSRQKDALWATEEALKCGAVSAVVGEISELSFTESRRLQLAVEQSRVTGFIHRHNPRSRNTVACITRWEIQPLMSGIEGMPGVGFPRWNVQLHKVRNGKPGIWQIEWSAGGFSHIAPHAITIHQTITRKAG